MYAVCVQLCAGSIVLLVVGASACASLSGLSTFSRGDDDAGAADHAVETGAESDDTSRAEGAMADEAGAQEAEDGDSSEVGAPARDAAAAIPDSGVDAAAVCHAECSGCCDSAGTCHGGQSTTTCGTGAAACQDCANAGKVCNVSVAAPQVDSGTPPMCVVTRCTNSCPLLPLVEAPCCKSDQTCGCGAVLGILLCN